MADAYVSVLSLNERLIRFLRTGTERTFFLPGKNKSYQRFRNVLQLMIEAGQGKEAVAVIKRINSEKSYFKRDPLIYFLAIATDCSNAETKKAGYAIVKEVCDNPVDFFMYLKHVKVLGQFNKGWGAGLRKVVCDWYNSRDPLQVAEFVTRYKRVGKWSHKDVFRLSHIKPTNEGIGFIVTVVCKGLAKAKEDTKEPSDVIKKLITYFDAVEFVKHSEDGTAMSIKMEEHGLHMEHIPTPLMSSKEIWNSLLRNMTLQDTLTHLPTLARRGFLTIPAQGSPGDRVVKEITCTVLQKVKDHAAIEKEKISPYLIYIMIRNYTREFSDKKKHTKSGVSASAGQKTRSTQTAAVEDPGKKKKKKKKKKKGGPGGEGDGEEVNHVEPPSMTDLVTKNNPELYEALHSAFRVAVEKNLPSTGKRYLIACKASIEELGKGIRGCPALSPLEVMALMATFYKKKEKSELGSFTASFSPMKYPGEVDALIQEIGNRAAPVPDLACDPAASITWALERKKKYDVFLILSDGHECKGDPTPAEKLQEYREKMDLPDTKVVICGLTAGRLDLGQAPGMLDIGGFDVTVPQIIHQFVIGQLDQ